MTDELKGYLRNWFLKAEHDLITAQTLLEHQPMILDIVCFHCQQAIEKYLKAFLIYKAQDVEKTHNLNYLQSLCVQLDVEFIGYDFKMLSEYAVKARYPDDFLMPEPEEAKAYLLLAQNVKLLAESKIKLD